MKRITHIATITPGVQSLKEHIESVEWCDKVVGERGVDWTVVWIGGYRYAFKRKADALMFTLRFSK